MRRKNLYYAQLGEAIALAKNKVFEYKRISLILFDNMVENLLLTQNNIKLHHLFAIGQITKNKYKKINDGFNRFENIVSQSYKLGVIEEKEKPIIEYCHKARNNLYHKLFEDERITEFCILYYCNFFHKYFESFIEIDFTSYSDKEEISSRAILLKERIDNLYDLIPRLSELYDNYELTPQKILCNIIEDYITTFEDFFECDAHESWTEFNKITKNQYFYDFEIKKKEHKDKDIEEMIPKFRLRWYNINDKNISKLKEKIIQLENLEIKASLEKFRDLNTKLEPIYIGIMLYHSEQEYLADLMDD